MNALDGETFDYSEFREFVADHTWIRSPGYRARGGYDVGPHEYVVCEAKQELFDMARTIVEKSPDAFDALFPPLTVAGDFRRYTTRYLVLDGYRYWCMWPIVNREREDG